MTKLPQWNSAQLKSSLIFGLSFWVGSGIFAACWAWFFTVQAITFLRAGNISAVSQSAKLGRGGTFALTVGTLGVIPDVRVWDDGLHILSNASRTTEAIHYVMLPISGGSVESSVEKPDLESIFSEQLVIIQSLLNHYNQSWFGKKVFKEPQWISTSHHTIGQTAAEILPLLLKGRHTYIILFQNTHELRPSGGFAGSFAKITVDEGQITELLIDDIYQPDGQFNGYRQAPPGVEEFLSGGKGWRLPDANWSPDFPTSAQNVMSYFALGELEDIRGVAAINLTVVERLLEITGPLELPDYQITVTAENLAEVARYQRESFFPGSQQKANLLKALSTQFKHKIQNLTPEQWSIFLQALIADTQRKNIQLFSLDEKVQQFSQKLDLDGQIWLPEKSDGLMAIEANVGINKVNPWISRTTELTINDYSAVMTTTWINTAAAGLEASRSAYINYHRLWVPPTWNVKTATLKSSDPTISSLSQPTTTSPITITYIADQQTWNEVGTLVRVPQGATTTLSIEFIKPSFQNSQPNMTIFNQSGLPPSPFTLTLPSGTTSWVHDSDVTVPLLQ